MTLTMRPLAELPIRVARSAVAVLTDIDDTLTEGGRLPALAYGALERLRDAGLLVIPVTGRPAGWCDLIARQWPVDAVVGENGAFWFRYDDASRRMARRFMRPDAEWQSDRRRLEAVAARVLREVEGTALASDQGYRAVDLAIDFSEDVAPLDREAVDRIVAAFEAEGATAKVSSIHVNAWYGAHDKLTTSLKLLEEEFGIDGAADRERIVYAGDSPNDSPMFGFFPNSVGVANVRDFEGRMPALPAYVTKARSAEGFAELADLLIAARATQPLQAVAGRPELGY
jgi:HAD superfamily hydrolase (TIGR01484 family)